MQATFLDKISRLFGFDAPYFIKNFSYLAVTGFISLVTSFLLAIFAARYLPKEIFGKYQYLTTIATTCTIFSLIGMRTAVSQAIARNLEGTYRKGLVMSLKGAFMGSLIIFVLGMYYWPSDSRLAGAFFVMCFLFAPFAISNYYTSYYVGKKDFKRASFQSTFATILATVMLILAIFFTQNLILLILAFLSEMLINGYFTLKVLKNLKNDEFDLDNLKFGLKLSIAQFGVNFSTYFDKIITGSVLGFSELAIYSFAIVIPEQIKGNIKSIETIGLPKLAILDKVQIKKDFLKKLTLFLFITAVIVAIYYLLAPLFYRIFFPMYLNSIRLSQLFSLSLIPAAGISFLTTLFHAKKQTKILAIMHNFYALIQIILISVFMFYYGLYGLVFARIATRVLTFAIGIYLFIKY